MTEAKVKVEFQHVAKEIKAKRPFSRLPKEKNDPILVLSFSVGKIIPFCCNSETIFVLLLIKWY